jgi:hypothetical protein
MSVENLLQRLDKVKRTGSDKWVACCPAHDSKSGASLAIREVDDGRILLHCFGGCGAGEVLGALGMEFADLYPQVATFHSPKVRRPWNASDVLRCLAFESLLIYQYATALSDGEILNEPTRQRLLVAVSRFQHGAEVANA